MEFKDKIYRIRKEMNMTQEQFADEFHVSKQAVQKWETGNTYPEISKLIEISKRFGVSLDSLLLNRDMRAMEEVQHKDRIVPNYSAIHDWELYSSSILDEYTQSTDEGLDVEQYKNIFIDISKLPKGEIKQRFSDIIFDIVINAEQRQDYKYIEPSDLSKIQGLRKPYKNFTYDKTKPLDSKILGAWMGRICGCMLGKSIEGIRSNELIPLLKDTGNYPMHRYILKKDLEAVDLNKYTFPLADHPYADAIDGMPADDDTNYTVLAQKIIEEYGRAFTPLNVAQAWMNYQPKDAYCTAERVAFCNFIKGYQPPYSAIYKNPYREWIGAQIRADYYGYINPGNPELAAEMAWRDASISHVKNGIYGAMFVSAMLAVAAVTNNIQDIILAGLAQIPYTSRLYEDIMFVFDGYKNGLSQKDCFKTIHNKYDENTGYWCHTNSNAMIVVASLLYGEGKYEKSICMAVEAAFDTDCNGATVGSILGMANGIDNIPECWTEPIKNKLHTSIFGVDTVNITEMAKKTLGHLAL